MGLDVWFPLAIYYDDLSDHAAHNPRLLTRIQALLAQSPAQRTSAVSSWTGDVHDVDRLHHDPAFDWLTGHVGAQALNYVKALGHDLAITDIYIQRAWPVISRRDQRVSAHTHHTAHISAVYYVAAPTEGDAGQIRFLNGHRPNELYGGIQSDMTQGYAQFNPLNHSSALYQPQPGRLILFPAKQPHAVDPNLTDAERVSIVYDLVITSRGSHGRHEFLMPAPALWRRVPRRGSDGPSGSPPPPQPPPVTGPGRTKLAALSRYGLPHDGFAIPDTYGHPLWTPDLLPDCASPAMWRACAAGLDDSATGCGDWRAWPGVIDRIYTHLRARDVPLDGATVTEPVLVRPQPEADAPFHRADGHVCVYLRLDRLDAPCALAFAEGGAVPLAPGMLMLVGGVRRQKIVGAGYILHAQIDLPALARLDALSLPGLQADNVEDYTVFAALTAQPVHLPLPTGSLLLDKLAWLAARARRRHRHQDCPATRRFILDQADPDTADADDIARIAGHGRGGDDPGRVVVRDGVLSAAACQLLRAHLDAHVTALVPDSVDDLPEYQVDLTPGGLAELVGSAQAEALCRLPETLGLVAGQSVARVDIFLRKYAPDARSSITFHADTCDVTANIALTGEDEIAGGRLLVLQDGRLAWIARAAGTLVSHAGNVVHGVSRITRGTRSVLILFYHLVDPAPACDRQDRAVGPCGVGDSE